MVYKLLNYCYDISLQRKEEPFSCRRSDAASLEIVGANPAKILYGICSSPESVVGQSSSVIALTSNSIHSCVTTTTILCMVLSLSKQTRMTQSNTTDRVTLSKNLVKL